MDRANALTVLINSPDPAMPGTIKARLRGSGIRVLGSQPGLSFMEMARQERPGIAVLDRVEERPDAVQMEISVLKELRQDTRIIAISVHPSPQDAWVVERGVFFYMAAPSLHELVRVIEAAAKPSQAATASAQRGEH